MGRKLTVAELLALKGKRQIVLTTPPPRTA